MPTECLLVGALQGAQIGPWGALQGAPRVFPPCNTVSINRLNSCIFTHWRGLNKGLPFGWSVSYGFVARAHMMAYKKKLDKAIDRHI